jgi:iron complex transport system substrate-binding protein
MAFMNGGRVVTFDRRPERILVMGLGAAELLAELGLEGLVMAAADIPPHQTPLPRYARTVAAFPVIDAKDLSGFESREDGPDFLFGRPSPLVPEPAFLKAFHTSAGTGEEFFMEVTDIGRLLGAEDRAETFVLAQRTRLSALRRRLAGAGPARVMILRGLRDGSFDTFGGPDFATYLVAAAGGSNVFAFMGSEPNIDGAQAIRHDPDFLLVVDDGAKPVEARMAEIRSDPDFAALRAVREGRVFPLEEAHLLPGPRLSESAEAMARHLHPGLVD